MFKKNLNDEQIVEIEELLLDVRSTLWDASKWFKSETLEIAFKKQTELWNKMHIEG